MSNITNQKIKILFTSLDQAGVFYWRTQTPALQLQQNHSDDFDITINQEVDWNNHEYLKQFNIIHTHRQFCQYEENDKFFDFCNKNNIVTILDIDDNPELHSKHPMYNMSKIGKLKEKTYDTIRKTDAITTTTDYFANIIRRYNSNVGVFNNAVNPDLMPQFKLKRKPESKDRLRLGYIGGSSHLDDFQLFRDMFSLTYNDQQCKEKFVFSLHGYDLRGSINNIQPNPNLVQEFYNMGGYIPGLLDEFSKANGDMNNITILPPQLKEKYKNTLVYNTPRNISPEESVWFEYEKIFTCNYKSLGDDNYVNHLKKYANEDYDNIDNQIYRRFFTKGINQYATHYDYIDLSLVPLQKNSFNDCKSPLKLAEACYKDCAVIVSDNEIYNKYIKHGVNGFIAKDNRDWAKLAKKMILDRNLYNDLKSKFVEDVKDEFSLERVTKERAEFYKDLVAKKNKS